MRISYFCYLSFLIFCFINIKTAFAQDSLMIFNDTTKIKEIRPKGKKIYDPDRAALLSAAIPGLGQIYNKQYWKLPIVYGGIGALYYFFQKNNTYYKSYRNANINFSNPNAHLKVDPKVKRKIDVALAQNSTTVKGALERAEAGWRRNRDLTIIISCAAYGLIIADAYVNAHLKAFTISKDLSFKAKPSVQPTLMQSPAMGLALNLNFK